MSMENSRNFGQIYKILSCWKCDIPIGQFTLSWDIFLDDLSFFFGCLICQVVFRFLSWMPSFPWKQKTKPFPNPGFGGGSIFVKLHLIKWKASVSLINSFRLTGHTVWWTIISSTLRGLSCSNLIFTNFDGIHSFSFLVETKAKHLPQHNTCPGFHSGGQHIFKYTGWFISVPLYYDMQKTVSFY